MSQRIVSHPITAHELSRSLSFKDCGGICSFEGVVRNHNEGKKVKSLIYEAYESMAEKELQFLIETIEDKWKGCRVEIKHRVGHLQIGDVAVAIVVWAPHRHEAFQACEATINDLKKRVPIWKHEFYHDGQSQWVICQHNHSNEVE